MKGKLFLIPTVLAESTHDAVLPSAIRDAVKVTEYFLCENVRTARRYISSLKVHPSIERLQFEVLDKDTKPEELARLMAPLESGKNIGVISESGCPGIADPGSIAVAYAHIKQIPVKPLVGPSSVLLALMASGLNGQQFAFHGYIPIEGAEAVRTIKNLERESREKNQTQIVIETPFRNNALMGHFLKTLDPNTRLCVGIHLTSDEENILTRTISEWRKVPLKFEKVPVIFLFLASA